MRAVLAIAFVTLLTIAPASLFAVVPTTASPAEALNAPDSSTVVCGDADRSGAIDITDVMFIVNYVFTGGAEPDPPQSGDENCDDAVNIADCVYLIAYLFEPGNPAPCCFSNADYCPRQHTVKFDLVTALQMARLAGEAYNIGPGLDTNGIITGCWQGVKFIQTDPNFSCGALQIPGQNDTQLYIARDPWTGDLVIAFRGTETTPDWVTDAQFAVPVSWALDDGTVIPLAVHRGFYCAYQSIKDELRSTLIDAIQKYADPSTARVYITGHSLGGALATLAAMDLTNWLINTQGYLRNNVVMYSFGAPSSMENNLRGIFDQRVPNSYAVMEKTDPVPYLLLLSYQPITKMIQINSHVDDQGNILQTRLDSVDGTEMTECGPTIKPVPWSYDALEAHSHDNYITRLQKMITPGVPTVSLSVSAGYLYVHWSGNVQGPCDMFGLCRGCPDVIDTIGYLGTGNWGYVYGGSGKPTLTPKTEGVQAAYLNSAGQVLARSAPYVSPKPSSLTITRKTLGRIEVTWHSADEGLFDYVALFSKSPGTAGPSGYIIGQIHPVLADLNDDWTTVLPGGPYWVAYVTSDALVGGNRRILKTAGPIY